MKNEFLLLIDGSSLLSTQFFGSLPKQILFAKTIEEKEAFFHKILQTGDGFYTNGVFGFIKYLLKILREQKPTHVAVAWDLTRNTFRRELYPDYKGNRTDTMAPLADQFAICEELVNGLGIAQFMSEEYEADDFCGSLAKKFEEEIPVVILTKDNDYLQLVNDKTKLWLMHSTAEKTDELYKKYQLNKEEINAPDRAFLFTKELIKKEFGIEAENVNSLKGIMGDPSDNIKGVSGVGEATARLLIGHYHTIEELYRDLNGKNKKELEEVKKRWKEELGIQRSPINYLLKTSEEELVGEAAARLSEKLATIKTDIDLGKIELEDLKLRLKRERGLKIFAALEFQSVNFEGIPEEMFADEEMRSNPFGLDNALGEGFIGENKATLITNLRKKAEEIEVSIEESSGISEFEVLNLTNKKEAELHLAELKKEKGAIGFSFSEEGLAVAIQKKEFRFLAGEALPVSYLKEEFERLLKETISATFVTFSLKEQLPFFVCPYHKNIADLSVAHYLLNPLLSSHELEMIAKDNKELFLGEDTTLIARCAFLSAEYFLRSLYEKNLDRLFYEVEMPLVSTLFEMEERGIKVEREALKAYGKELDALMKNYEKEIYEAAGEVFNINSPKQLGVILFEKLKLPHGKKTKTGFSTNADVLEKIKYEDPIVLNILNYRQVAKLKSTYADGLETYIKEDGRIHCKLNQLVTATGRLSSTEPNLQNIPIRTELGKRIRKVFVPKDGYVFIDADYSQIELRIMAHLSGDEELIEAYRSAKDIHRITAAKVFGVPFEKVTEEQRRNAKAVNFGIIYGISSFGLGENLGISVKEAEGYIKEYFAAYPKVKDYLDALIEEAKKEGFVTTIFGRIRPVPELYSNNFSQRQFGERIAMNSPVQGTAADIIKIAMINVNNRLKKEYVDSRLILQIHDELLIEAKEEDKEAVSALVKEEMMRAANLKIPLEAEVKFGTDWYESH